MSEILTVEGLEKSYGSLQAVKGIQFSIQQGEIFSLLGPNGAGKTTTISMLSTLIQPTHGDAHIDGFSILRDALKVRRVIGVVPQDIAVYETLTARENLLFWGRLYGLSGTELQKRTGQILEQIGLTDRAKSRVETFSGGMKRRLNIGVGLLHQPKIIFMDEPTVGIDPQSRRNILDAVKDLNRQGLTILYTTHYMEEAEELSNRVGIIDHGQMMAIGTQKELTRLVGEHETLRIHLGEDQPAGALVSELQKIPAVIQASATDGDVVVIVPSAGEALAPVIGCTNQLNYRIRGVDIQEPNLEAVFLHITGRALRD